eukprot:4432755-Pleurochrysis_carterae.AAC.1
MQENNTTRWSFGRMIVRWQINANFARSVGQLPYVLVYGQRPRVGISGLPIAPELLEKLATEAELN